MEAEIRLKLYIGLQVQCIAGSTVSVGVQCYYLLRSGVQNF